MLRPAARWSGLALCEGWSRKDRARFAALADLVEYEPGDLVLAQGRTRPELIVLLTGAVDLVDFASSRRLGVLRPGEWTGHEAVLTGEPQPVSAVARGFAQVLHVQPRELRGWVAQSPAVHRSLAGLGPSQRRHVRPVAAPPRLAV